MPQKLGSRFRGNERRWFGAKQSRSSWIAVAAGLALAALAGIGPVSAQAQPNPASNTQPTVAAGSVVIPGFWDPRRRPERPDLSRVTLIRFITEIDYPPFNYSGPDGNPAGLNVDLARMVCEELKIACTVQMRRFDTLLPSLGDNRGDAVMASIAVTPEARKLADFSDPYYRTPGRFVARRDAVHQRRAARAARRQEGRGGRRHRA